MKMPADPTADRPKLSAVVVVVMEKVRISPGLRLAMLNGSGGDEKVPTLCTANHGRGGEEGQLGFSMHGMAAARVRGMRRSEVGRLLGRLPP